jgi:phosphohistidine swiveling domain-containing protein
MENKMNKHSLVYTHNEVVNHLDRFGQKIIRLGELKQRGYSVPAFVGIDSAVVLSLVKENDAKSAIYTELVGQVRKEIPTGVYAVRSSAFVEDGATSSHAGEFLTKLAVTDTTLADAVYDVIKDALDKGYATDTSPFSVIVQEYIPPDVAGVVFTRNPFGRYEMDIEWSTGNGEVVVGGGASQRITFAWNRLPVRIPFACFEELIEESQKIEEEYNYPQDIEWACRDGKLYILQSRAITTISVAQYKGLLLLDQSITEKEYYYERASLSESFNNPLPLAQEILEYLHQGEGALGRAYAKLGITYHPYTIFKKFGNALFLDKEMELKQFFPAYSYFGSSLLSPHIATMRGLWTTFKNVYRFQSLKPFSPVTARENLLRNTHHILPLLSKELSFKEWLVLTNDMYKDVFTINIFAEKVYKDLDTLTTSLSWKALELLESSVIDNEKRDTDNTLFSVIENIKIVGNSLNISDESPFVAKKTISILRDDNSEIRRWWETLPHRQQMKTKKLVLLAREYGVLREQGRWVTALCMTGLRDSLKRVAKEKIPNDSSLCYFATISEIQNNILDQVELEERRKNFEKGSGYVFPMVIPSTPLTVSKDIYGVSPGEATGTIAILGGSVAKGNILFVDTLDPMLTKYFGVVSGVIAREGGILSHLAIVAREYKIAVVVDKRRESKYEEGQMVKIDGGKGTIILK